MVTYTSTNETLSAITNGLDVNRGDRVFAICGSGDQAFAMLEYADYVLAVDADHEQINYARYRANKIRKGDYDGFLERSNLHAMEYFDEIRFNELRKKEDCLEFQCVNVEDFKSYEDFGKIYLSNALGFSKTNNHGLIERLLNDTKIGSLIYITEEFDVEYYVNCLNKKKRRMNVNDRLTKKAKRFELDFQHNGWSPVVYDVN